MKQQQAAITKERGIIISMLYGGKSKDKRDLDPREIGAE